MFIYVFASIRNVIARAFWSVKPALISAASSVQSAEAENSLWQRASHKTPLLCFSENDVSDSRADGELRLRHKRLQPGAGLARAGTAA
jgi:hypothetical protein